MVVQDEQAPKSLVIEIKDPSTGKVWGMFAAEEKTFSSGSVGFYANGKVVNPVSGKKYQLSMPLTLVGSKPKA